jgi:hypothetical protein
MHAFDSRAFVGSRPVTNLSAAISAEPGAGDAGPPDPVAVLTHRYGIFFCRFQSRDRHHVMQKTAVGG